MSHCTNKEKKRKNETAALVDLVKHSTCYCFGVKIHYLNYTFLQSNIFSLYMYVRRKMFGVQYLAQGM